jgi:hypothetical protein
MSGLVSQPARFTSVSDAKMKLEQWREDHDKRQSIESRGYLAPNDFARQGQRWKRPQPV